MKCLIFLACLAVVSYAQQCGSEFEEFRVCMDRKDGTSKPEPPKPFPEGSVSVDVTNCFTSSGCEAPTLVGAEAAASEEMMGPLIKCSDEVKDEIKPLIQQCMDATPNVGPGFVLHPDLIAPLPLSLPNPPPAPPVIVILHSVSQVYNDHICPTNTKKNATRKCVTGVAEKFIPHVPTKSPIETAFELNKHCYSQEVCKAEMTPVCKQDVENLRAYLCNCAKQVFSTQQNVQNIVDTFRSCMVREAGTSAVQQPAVMTFTTYAQRLATNLMCLQAPDPCKVPEQYQSQQAQAQAQAQA